MTQIIIAALSSFIIAMSLTGVLTSKFRASGIGQEIREEGPESHQTKRGTPTMGGLAIVVSIVLAYAFATVYGALNGHGGPSASGIIALALVLALGGLGFADDYIKIFRQRNLGLTKTQKLVIQAVIGICFGIAIVLFPNEDGLSPGSTHLSFVRDIDTIDLAFGGGLGMIIFVPFIYLVVAAWSNAVNLTDGLDGLAAGISVLVFSAYAVITFWQYQNSCSVAAVPGCYDVRDPLDLAIIAASGIGASLGFLWWNRNPARIFMGDTGSMALGGMVIALSVMSRTELLGIIIALICVLETISVIIQVAVFRTTGKRFFRMSPLHHHFEKGGWREIHVVWGFWAFTLLSVGVGLAIFFSESLSYGVN
ncbi:phospho-N-acetylmuramoyl-pentapeptide-transferase [Corynebacterium sp. ES2794-CONJ1]|uniref:phospho-N-acetylmuramoyl-pentapeptide- transferase n=1 Tax=unclassified Corynebacterium TaxID=2624378 RepID=UPI0021688C02|nr:MULTISPECIES: phospho-N-acetylmuramoyl-pentapeptide-transferase [unclassified Corynebacterium]MCS4489012.1 phospho-N-acetylmuramoyl-pentapeptide-transferase [Corynebacterium sp. ES2775-CONJ]MCS4490825.1 phospho-N-acetylmuramoyl-pentapeptide-transferase [Corynebacterium sp. ES2715-CONJ3]MCS4531292.1 phospho-N-acetylmuramoyl-pentapeptide-transferase [Corynebacterium sp. ES2730-CONJ]MCU9518661.1 phospho-N-acetylmuramoyl-pentapeptide-transferase [Corynebacterium sp. ES2794-CONJ1]